MQPSATAPSGRSVWDVVRRDIFESNVAALKRQKFVFGAHVYAITEERAKETTAETSGFHIDIERELADDFAFIAAYEEGVRTVTAAVIEVSSRGMNVVLAANEGVHDCVDSTFQDMFRLLEACACCELSRESCATQLLDIVVSLNRNRIYGRLGSVKYSAPPHRCGPTPDTLPAQLHALIDKQRHVRASPDWSKFNVELEEFRQKFCDMEKLEVSNDKETMISILVHIHAMTVDGISLPRRLALLGFSTMFIECKQVRQLMKLANYVRICKGLSEKARSLRGVFNRLRFQKLEPFAPSLWNNEQRFIHAEIQIIVHFTKYKSNHQPRVIGASKEACFLCDAFVRAHGHYQLSRAHRQLYDRWSIPDLGDYESIDLVHMQRCLYTVNQELIKAKRASQKTRRRIPFPIQSSINLIKALVRNASMSTITSLQNSAAGTSTAQSADRFQTNHDSFETTTTQIPAPPIDPDVQSSPAASTMQMDVNIVEARSQDEASLASEPQTVVSSVVAFSCGKDPSLNIQEHRQEVFLDASKSIYSQQSETESSLVSGRNVKLEDFNPPYNAVDSDPPHESCNSCQPTAPDSVGCLAEKTKGDSARQPRRKRKGKRKRKSSKSQNNKGRSQIQSRSATVHNVSRMTSESKVKRKARHRRRRRQPAVDISRSWHPQKLKFPAPAKHCVVPRVLEKLSIACKQAVRWFLGL